MEDKPDFHLYNHLDFENSDFCLLIIENSFVKEIILNLLLDYKFLGVHEVKTENDNVIDVEDTPNNSKKAFNDIYYKEPIFLNNCYCDTRSFNKENGNFIESIGHNIDCLTTTKFNNDKTISLTLHNILNQIISSNNELSTYEIKEDDELLFYKNRQKTNRIKELRETIHLKLPFHARYHSLDHCSSILNKTNLFYKNLIILALFEYYNEYLRSLYQKIVDFYGE